MQPSEPLACSAAEALIRGPPCPSAVDPAAICTAAAAGVGGGEVSAPSAWFGFSGGVVVEGVGRGV